MKYYIIKRYLTYIFITGIIMNLYNCGIFQKPYSHIGCDSIETFSSDIIRNELIGIQDTTIVKIKGTLTENKEFKSGTKLEFTNSLTKKTYTTITDFDGNYNIYLDNGTYKLLAFDSYRKHIDLGEFPFKSGEIRVLDLDFEAIEMFEEYVIKFKSKRDYEKTLKKAGNLSLLEYFEKQNMKNK